MKIAGKLLPNEVYVKGIFRILILAAIVSAIDQFSKELAISYLSVGERINIIPGCFDITLTFNKGVAFGLFSNITSDFVRLAVLSLTTIIALSAVVYFFVFEFAGTLSGELALAMILGGAVGNIIDRVQLGHVIDFFLAYYRQYSWPVFNVADSAISVGVLVLLLFHSRRAVAQDSSGGESPSSCAE